MPDRWICRSSIRAWRLWRGVLDGWRRIPSGGPGETDVYGCQQYAPLFALEVPWDD